MSQHEWAESSPLFFYSQRWTWNLLPASRKRSGNPSILNLVNVWLQFTRRQPKEGSSPTPQGILNHCFDDIENFMAKLQQTAEAATVLNQRKKKNKKKSKKQSSEGKKGLFFIEIAKSKIHLISAHCLVTTEDLLTAKARPPPEEEFVDIFQKFKYCFSLLVCGSCFFSPWICIPAT